jgi:hypothetical protein
MGVIGIISAATEYRKAERHKMHQRSKIVKHFFRTITALAISVMGTALVPALKADDWNHKTNIKIDRAIDVEGTVLPAGSYVVKLLDSTADRRIVQIYNAEENHLLVTVLATSAYRLSPGDTDFKFYESAAGQTPSLRAWFYPGDNYGLGFRDVPVQSGGQHASVTTSNKGGE